MVYKKTVEKLHPNDIVVSDHIEHRNEQDELHCENGPAVIIRYRQKRWSRKTNYQDEQFWLNGNKIYETKSASGPRKNILSYFNSNGEAHRIDGPAIITEEKFKKKSRKNTISYEWYVDGLLHRIDGPAFEDSDGNQDWYIRGVRHRVDGPARIHSSGTKSWYLNDLLHRTDGPAFEDSDGSQEWWLLGFRVSENYFDRLMNSEVKTLFGILNF
jgi:hypothetical protein